MNINSVPALITAVTSILLGGFVYIRGRAFTVNRLWAVFSLIIALWSLSVVMIMNAPNERAAFWWARMIYFTSIPIPIVFLHFITAYVQSIHKRKIVLILGYAVSALFIALNCTDLIIRGVTSQQIFRYFGVPGKAYFPFFSVWIVLLGLCFIEMLLAYKEASAYKKNAIKYLMCASIIGFAGGTTSFLPAFDITLSPYGHYFVSLYALFITYAIVQHRLMDINFVIKKGVTYFYASFLLLIPIYGLLIIIEKVTLKAVNYPFSAALLGAIVFAAYFFPKVKLRAERTVEQFIFKNKYDYRKTISNLSRAMVSILNINNLCSRIITTTTEAMAVEKASIYILNEEENHYKLCEAIGLDHQQIVDHYHKDDPFLRWIEKHDEIFLRDELERYTTDTQALSIAERMKQMEAEICIPLITKQRLLGIINLGIKGSGEMYTHEDLELLLTLSNQAAVAVENATLYENLAKTKVKMQRADRLASLGTLTAGLAHEIRNPLVAIKTFTQLLPERFDDDEFRNHFLNVTSGEVDRISSLVTELLEFARPSQPNLNKEDLNQVVEKMILLVATQSEAKNLQLIKRYQEFLPPVVLDKEQIKQVFLNVLLNAIDATPEEGVITVETKLMKKNGFQDFVQIIVQDTGKGIAKEELDKIFTPFYTNKDQGSGLGLAISHQIIQEHHGSIEVESEEGKGSTFYINLPIDPLLIQSDKPMEAMK